MTILSRSKFRRRVDGGIFIEDPVHPVQYEAIPSPRTKNPSQEPVPFPIILPRTETICSHLPIEVKRDQPLDAHESNLKN